MGVSNFKNSEGPKTIPGLKPTSKNDGNLEEMSNAGSLHEFLMELHNEFGPIASFWWGKIYTISIASADLFEEQKSLFDRPSELFEFFTPLFEPKCIQFANKEEGVKRRQHYCKALSENAIKGYFPQIQEVADELVEKWGSVLGEPAIPVMRYTSMFTLKAILHTLFGNLMKDEKEELDFRSESDEVWSEIELRFIKPRTVEREKHLQEDKKDLEELIKKMLQDRKTKPPKQGEETLLDLFISFSDDEEIQLADSLEFTTSGLYTIEALLTCALFYVATHSETDRKLFEEIQIVLGDNNVSDGNMRDLTFLRQVLDETLRCSVFGVFAARFQEVDSKLGGYDIPKNTPVIHAVGVAMKDSKVWMNPDTFDPDRFSKENQQQRSKLWFSPFGVGKRECLAREFTYAVATVAMVTLLKKFRFSPLGKAEGHNPLFGLSTHHKEEVLLRLSAR